MKREINWDVEEQVYKAHLQEAILIHSDDSSDEGEPATPVHSAGLQTPPPVKRSYSESECDSGAQSGYVTPATAKREDACSEFSDGGGDGDDSEYGPPELRAVKVEPATPSVMLHRRSNGAVSSNEKLAQTARKKRKERYQCSEEEREGEEEDKRLGTVSRKPLPKRSRSGPLEDETEVSNEEEELREGGGEEQACEVSLTTDHCEEDGEEEHPEEDEEEEDGEEEDGEEEDGEEEDGEEEQCEEDGEEEQCEEDGEEEQFSSNHGIRKLHAASQKSKVQSCYDGRDTGCTLSSTTPIRRYHGIARGREGSHGSAALPSVTRSMAGKAESRSRDDSDSMTFDVFLDTVPGSHDTVSRSRDRRRTLCDSTTATPTPRRLLATGRPSQQRSRLVPARLQVQDGPPASRDGLRLSRELQLSDTPTKSPSTSPAAVASSSLVTAVSLDTAPMSSDVLSEGSVAWGRAGSLGGTCDVCPVLSDGCDGGGDVDSDVGIYGNSDVGSCSGGRSVRGDGALHANSKFPPPPTPKGTHSSILPSSSCRVITPSGPLPSLGSPACHSPALSSSSSSIKHHVPSVLNCPGLCFSPCIHHHHHQQHATVDSCTALLLTCGHCCVGGHRCHPEAQVCRTHPSLLSPCSPHLHLVNGAVTPHTIG